MKIVFNYQPVHRVGDRKTKRKFLLFPRIFFFVDTWEIWWLRMATYEYEYSYGTDVDGNRADYWRVIAINDDSVS